MRYTLKKRMNNGVQEGNGWVIWPVLLCVVLLYACNEPWRPVAEVPTPPDSQVNEFQRILSGDDGSGRYWYGRYTPHDEYGTFNVLLHFRRRSVTIYSDDVTYKKERDEGVLYDIEEGLTNDQLIFSSYCIFHEMSENRKGEFEFYVKREPEEAATGSGVSTLILESLSDDFNDLTTFSIVALDANGADEEAALTSQLEEMQKIRAFMDDIKRMEDSRVSIMSSPDFGLEIPIKIDTSKRVFTFLSQTNSLNVFEELSYPFSPLVEDGSPAALVLSPPDDASPFVVSGGRQYRFSGQMLFHRVDREQTQDFCTKDLYESVVTFPSFEDPFLEFVIANGGGVGANTKEIERILRTGVRLFDAEFVYGGGSSGLEGGLEHADFEVDLQLQVQWRNWKNCGSVVIAGIPNSPVSIVRDIGVREIKDDYISFKALNTADGRVWDTHINQDFLTSLDSTEEAEYQRYPVPDAIRFFNEENGLKYAFYMITGEGSRFFVEIDRDISQMVFTSLCYDFKMTFSYDISESSCYLEYEPPPDPLDPSAQ